MANDLNRSIKIYLDNSSAMTSAEQLQQRIDELKNKLLGLQTAGKGNTEQAKKVDKELIAQTQKFEKYKREVADTERVLRNLSGATYDQLIKAKKEIDKQLKSTTRNTELYNQRLQVQKAISKELALAQKDLRTEIGCQASTWGRAADWINKYMGIIGSAVAGITGVTMVFAKFRDERDKLEASTANLKALTGLGDEDVKRLENTAKRLSTTITKEGVRIKQSAIEIDDSFAIIGSQRPELLKNAEALEAVTQDAIYLSIASKDKLEPAAKALTTVMNQMNLGAENSRRIINAIAAGSQAGAGNIQYITDAFEKSGTTANLMNIQLEQHIGLIEAVAPKYSEAALAGNSLDKVLLKMKEKGIGYKDGMFDLSRAIDEIGTRFKKGESAASLFGVEHAKMAEILVMNKKDIDQYTAAVTGTNKAVEQAQINSDINEAKRAQARNKMNLLGMELMEKLNPAITSTMNQTVHWTGKLVSLATWISKNSGMLITLASVLATYTIAVKAVIYWQKIQNAEFVASTTVGKAWTVVAGLMKSAQIALAGTQALLTGNVTRAKAAWILLNRTMLVNPFVAIGTVIAGLTVGIYKLATRTTEAARANKEFSKELDKEKVEARLLFDALKRANEGTDTRRRLIQTINEKYGQYLTNQLTEKSNLNEIDTALKQVNSSLETQIGLRIKNESASSITEEFINDVANKYDYIRKEVAKQSSEDIAGMYVSDLKELVQAGGMSAYEMFVELKKKHGNVLTSSAYRDLMRIKRLADGFKQEMAELDGKFAFLNKPVTKQDEVVTNSDNDDSGNKEVESKKSLLEIQRELREEAEKMPETTEAEVVAKNKLLKTIDNEISRLSKLGVEKDNSEKEEKKATDAKLKEVDRYITEKKLKLTQDFSDGVILYDDYNKQLEALELEKLNKQLEIYNIGSEERKKIEQLILDNKVKLLEQGYQEYLKNLEKERSLNKKKEELTKAHYDKLNQQLQDFVKKQMDEKAKALQEEEDKKKEQFDIMKNFGSEAGQILGQALTDTETTFAESMHNILLLTLDTLRQVVVMAIAERTIKNIGSLGFLGLAKAAAEIALINVAFGALKGLIKKPSASSANQVADNKTPVQGGQRIASGSTSGFYVGGWSGDGSPFEVAGPVHRKEYVVPSFVMSEPAAMNHVGALEAMRRQKTNANPLPLPVAGFGNGGYAGDAGGKPNGIGMTSATEQLLIALLTSLNKNGVRAYVVYSDIDTAQKTLDKSKMIGGK